VSTATTAVSGTQVNVTGATFDSCIVCSGTQILFSACCDSYYDGYFRFQGTNFTNYYETFITNGDNEIYYPFKKEISDQSKEDYKTKTQERITQYVENLKNNTTFGTNVNTAKRQIPVNIKDSTDVIKKLDFNSWVNDEKNVQNTFYFRTGKQYNPNDPNTHGKIRKLSMTCQLTDGSEYSGGELQFDCRNYDPHMRDEDRHLITVKEILPKGSIVVFPSFVWHRVQPVTRGTRYSLVVWNLGYPFK
jgi:hypothetical protein